MTARRRRLPPMRTRKRVENVGVCQLETCGKVMYSSRADARKAAKLLFPGDHLTAYQCGDFWHFGHEPLRVLHGEGWGGEDRLEKLAERVREETDTPPIECEGCGVEVTWSRGDGYAHECEVVGIEDESEGR